MNQRIKKLLLWTPRVLGILFALFISLFALDVFGEAYGFWQTIAALLIHLAPTYLVITALVIAWRWAWIGAVLFSGLASFYIVMAWGKLPLITYLVISGPLALIGFLFLFNWIYREQLRAQ